MKAKVLMVQGTASHVGKSVLVTALCRIFRNDGLKVAPFKAQNMSLNSYVTPDGGEIGRAQAVQAEACGIAPSVDMNPILLKPEANSRSQVVVLGRPRTTTAASDYYNLKPQLWPVVTSALDRLRSEYDVVVIEGAGSPAEINLASAEIVNMSIARYCQSPVLLVGDIDRGGVFASLLGTLWLLEPNDLSLVKALVINKFRGDRALLEPGLRLLELKTGVPVAGVLPYFQDIYIAQEDSLSLEEMKSQGKSPSVDIAVIRLPHISNFDDFDPLGREEGVRVRYVNSVESLNKPDLIIIPGSKTTMSDLDWLERNGLAHRITGLYEQGAFVIGICGGYQMLGKSIEDPDRVESPVSYRQGMGLLPVSTVFLPTKDTHQIKGDVVAHSGLLSEARGISFEGYEIHMGRTECNEGSVFRILERSGQPCEKSDGCLDTSGRVLGTYIHGLFHNQELRRAILRHIAGSKDRLLSFAGEDQRRDCGYDKLAELVRRNLDMDLVYAITGLQGKRAGGV
ncbi:MAG: cobyric acid synthase [Dehalococcoidia bacterium]|nr:cobyric acid synthase [Dehalococcoidia bacterium]